MDLEKELLHEHSRKQTLYIAKHIGNDQEKLDGLVSLMLKGAAPVPQRAAWVVSKCSDDYPDLINKHLKILIKNFKRPCHDAVKRNTLRILCKTDIPENLWGTLADACFHFLISSQESIAVKAFSMTVLYNLTKQVPELKNELKIIIEDQMPYASPAFISRGRKILHQFSKQG